MIDRTRREDKGGGEVRDGVRENCSEGGKMRDVQGRMDHWPDERMFKIKVKGEGWKRQIWLLDLVLLRQIETFACC